MKLKLYLFAFLGIALISSCKKAALDPVAIKTTTTLHKQDSTADVWVAGYLGEPDGTSIAVYWKNGVMHKLADSAVATAIAVRDSDVYISLDLVNSDHSSTAALWHNGQITHLEHNAATARGHGIAISDCGCEVYVGGYAGPDYYAKQALYWKNGVRHTLPGNAPRMEVNGITVRGHDVYTAGTGILYLGNKSYVLYWKNDTPVLLTDSASLSFARAIDVQGNNVYVAGAYGEHPYPSGRFPNYDIAVWKNGVQSILTDPAPSDNLSSASGIAVKGNNVYVSSNSGFGSYWVNNTITHLYDINTGSVTNDIALYQNDAYVAGASEPNVLNTKSTASYWKNGQLVQLPKPSASENSNALSITVTPHGH